MIQKECPCALCVFYDLPANTIDKDEVIRLLEDIFVHHPYEWALAPMTKSERKFYKETPGDRCV